MNPVKHDQKSDKTFLTTESQDNCRLQPMSMGRSLHQSVSQDTLKVKSVRALGNWPSTMAVFHC